MAETTLRQLIAKVVFRADPKQLQSFDARVEQLRKRLFGVSAQAAKRIKPALDATPVQTFITKLRALGDELKSLPGRASAAFKKIGGAAKPAHLPAAPDVPAKGGGLGALGGLVGSLGAAAAAYKAIDWGKQLASEARAVGDLAAALSIGTDELQTWSAFAEEVGASNEDLSGTVKGLTAKIQEAAKEADGAAAKAFKKLGLSTAGWSKELPGTMDVLLEAGGALSELENDTERLALAQQLLGEAGLKLLPAFEGGAAAAKDQLDSLRDLAVVYDKDFIANATAAANEMALFERQLKGVGAEVVLGVLPALRDFVRWITPVVKGVRDVVKNSNILTSVFTVLGGAGIFKLGAQVGKLITKFGGFTNVLKAAGRIVLRFILPMLVLDDLISFLKGEGSVFGDILDSMFGAGTAKKVVDGLNDSWKALTGVVKYFWGILKGDQAAIDEGESLILKFGGTVDDVFNAIGAKFKEWGNLFVEAAEFAFNDFTSMLEGWGDGILGYLSGVWTSIVDGLSAMLTGAVEKVQSFASNLPIVGGLFKSGDAEQPPATRLAQNADRALGIGSAPTAQRAPAANVTVNDNSTVTSNLNGVDASNVGSALRQTERNITAELKRSKAQVLRQTVGAVAP